MRLIDADEATRLYDHMGPAREISGGSAGNTAAGRRRARRPRRLHRPGRRRPARRGLRARHPLGRGRVHHARAADVERADRALPGPRHARRAADDEHLPRRRPASARRRRSTRRRSRSAAILYLEGYLWDPETPRAAMERAIDDRPRGGPQGRLHAVRQLLHRPPPRRLQRADRQRPDRHLVRQRGRDLGADRRGRFRGGGRARRRRRVPTAGRHPQREGRDRGLRAASARRGAGRAGRRGGRHDRRRRPVRGRLPRRPGAGPQRSSRACAWARSPRPR